MVEKTSSKTTFSYPSELEIVMSRVFDAGRERIFKAYTDPRSIPLWWGQRGSTTRVDKMDVRPGGQWRYIEKDKEGHEHGFRGEYKEIVPPERLVNTFEYEPMPGHVSVVTTTFEELPGGKTRVTTTSRFSSKADRDGMMTSGMERGANETWDRLAERLAKG